MFPEMKKFKILVINPGSTSTKVSLFEDETSVFEKSLFHDASDLLKFPHVNDQVPFRRDVILGMLEAEGVPPESIDAEKVARVALSLGAGREKAGDRIDPLAGVTLAVGVGDKVTTGQQLATLERSADPDGLEPAAAELYRAFRISSSAPEQTPLILERI